jgi:hypothetical protein
MATRISIAHSVAKPLFKPPRDKQALACLMSAGSPRCELLLSSSGWAWLPLRSLADHARKILSAVIAQTVLAPSFRMPILAGGLDAATQSGLAGCGCRQV